MKQRINTILMTLVMLFATTSITSSTISANTNDNVQYYKAYQYTQKMSYASDFDPWERVNIPIVFNLTTDQIIIYSQRTQTYYIYKSETYISNEGRQAVRFYFVDQDLDKGSCRLVIRKDGTSQIYIDFANISWVYNVIRTK